MSTYRLQLVKIMIHFMFNLTDIYFPEEFKGALEREGRITPFCGTSVTKIILTTAAFRSRNLCILGAGIHDVPESTRGDHPHGFQLLCLGGCVCVCV